MSRWPLSHRTLPTTVRQPAVTNGETDCDLIYATTLDWSVVIESTHSATH